MFEIINYEDANGFDTAISGLLKAVYIDAGFTPVSPPPRGFSIEEVKQRGKILLALSAAKDVLGIVIVGTHLNPYRQVATEDEVEMQLLGTAPDARGRGVGEALCRAFEARAREDGFRKAVLSTQPMMHAAHKLYAKLGYIRNPARDWERGDRKFWVYEKAMIR
jgi:ribosomal protein S18 acetylase RimI-like enzyme